jgi:hypothetical protein
MDTTLPPRADASFTGDSSAAGDDAGGGDGASGGDGTTGGDGATVGDAAGGGDAQTQGDSGAGEAGGGDAGPPGPPECDPLLPWSTLARVPSIAPAGFDRFGSISSDELTVAWTSSSGAIFVADRASVSASFGAPAQVSTSGVAVANGRVALTASAFKLIATLADGSSFVSFERFSVGGAWTPSLSNDFPFVAAMIAESGGAMAEPVVSADGLSLFYLLTIGTGAGSLPILYESTWDVKMKKWTSGLPLPNPEFAITSASQRRRATGASDDRRTLFFFDEVSGKERAAWRASPTAPFDTFVDVAAAPEAAPNASCDPLYFHGSDGTGQGLFTAAR